MEEIITLIELIPRQGTSTSGMPAQPQYKIIHIPVEDIVNISPCNGPATTKIGCILRLKNHIANTLVTQEYDEVIKQINKVTKTKYNLTCKICGADNATAYRIPTYRTFNTWDEKTKFSPVLSVENIDLCDKCALEATNIHSIGLLIGDKYELKPKSK